MSNTVITTAFRAVEQRYLERARAVVEAAPWKVEAILVDRRVPPSAKDPGAVIAGWWTNPGADQLALILPNPWDDRSAVQEVEAYAWLLTCRVVDELAERLNTAHGTDHPPDYWHVLLGPWALHTVSAIVDRRLYVDTAVDLVPDATFLTGPLSPAPGTMGEAVSALRTDDGNRSLVSEIVRLVGAPRRELASDEIDDNQRPHRSSVDYRHHGLRDRLFRAGLDPTHAASRALGIGIAPLLTMRRGRRVTIVGQSNMRDLQLARLWLRYPGLRVIPPGRTAAVAVPAEDLEARARLRWQSDEPMMALLSRLVPRLLPRSIVEGYRDLVVRSEQINGPPSHVVVGNYSNDELINEFAARCVVAKKRLVFSQHGAIYRQALVNSAERLELGPRSTFLSWGGTGLGVVPTPSPFLERLRGRHRGGRRVVLIEPLEPPDAYVVRFWSLPLGNQAYEPGRMLAEFANAVDRTREHLVLKRFPPWAPQQRPAALEELPHSIGRGAVRGPEWMRGARLTVIAFPSTALIEAMVLGTPIIGLWRPEHWEVRADAAEIFDLFFELGVFFEDPQAAARQVDAVYDRADSWWSTPPIAAARAAFIDRFGVAGDWLAGWSRVIRGLR